MTSLIFLSLVLAGCKIPYRDMNVQSVERLRKQMVQERYEDIYDQSSDILRAQITKVEFVNGLKKAGEDLRAIDPELRWIRIEGSPEPAVYYDENWSSLHLEKDSRKADIQLDWNSGFRLCGMLINGDIPNGANRVFRNCD